MLFKKMLFSTGITLFYLEEKKNLWARTVFAKTILREPNQRASLLTASMVIK